MEPNFLELDTVEAANKVDLEVYCFVRLSDSRGYVFKRRRNK